MKNTVFKILYIEDNITDQYVMLKFLKYWFPSVSLLNANIAHLGLEIATNEQPDLILLDIRLPRMTGYEALEFLKSDPITRDIPVWAITGFAFVTDIRNGLNAGFKEYITKPWTRENLGPLIQKEIDKKISYLLR